MSIERSFNVKQKENKVLEKKGFMEVHDYLDRKIVERQSNLEYLNGYERLMNISQYFDASAAFHQPGGDGYKLVLNCLQKYLDFKFIRDNNTFRFDESLFDDRVSIISDRDKINYEYIVHNQSPSYQSELEGTRADIYYLLNEADQNGIATRRCISYMHSNRLHLTAVLIQLIERAIENLENDIMQKHRDYARVIKTAYMTPEYAEADVFTLFEILKCSKKQYYRLRNAAITLLSETLFGIFAGENGFADLYIRNDEIRIPAMMNR